MRTFFIYLQAFFLVIGSLPKLSRVKKRANEPFSKKAGQISHTPAQIAKKIIAKTGSTVTVTGLEKIPDQPVLFIANHQGLFDILLLLAYLEEPIGFIAKKEIKKIPIVNKWMTELKCVFIDRSNRRSALKVIDDGIQSLQEGHSMVVFPEGTRGEGREINPFKPGSLRLATRANVPIVPIAIDGTYQIYEKNNRKVKASDVTLAISDPIYPEQYQSLKHKQLATDLQQTIKNKLNH